MLGNKETIIYLTKEEMNEIRIEFLLIMEDRKFTQKEYNMYTNIICKMTNGIKKIREVKEND